MQLRTRNKQLPAIPIVSLIDIMVILLIFVVATTTFKKKKQVMNIALPETKHLASGEAPPKKTSSIAVTKDQQLFFDEKPVQPDQLANALRQWQQTYPGGLLELEADETAPLGLIVKIWDALREAGYNEKQVPARIKAKNNAQ
jgi:biopolymer transport protein ExbD